LFLNLFLTFLVVMSSTVDLIAEVMDN